MDAQKLQQIVATVMAQMGTEPVEPQKPSYGVPAENVRGSYSAYSGKEPAEYNNQVPHYTPNPHEPPTPPTSPTPPEPPFVPVQEEPTAMFPPWFPKINSEFAYALQQLLTTGKFTVNTPECVMLGQVIVLLQYIQHAIDSMAVHSSRTTVPDYAVTAGTPPMTEQEVVFNTAMDQENGLPEYEELNEYKPSKPPKRTYKRKKTTTKKTTRKRTAKKKNDD